jgi:GNAT superfamily N-acetyltransferase
MYPHIRKATADDVPRILEIARQYRDELGYLHPVGLRQHISAGTVHVAEWYGNIYGFVDYHTRRDGWSTIYHIATDKAVTEQGIGRYLLYSVPCPFRLKVTQDNPANTFYQNAGMQLIDTETGRKRPLNVYQLRVMVALVHEGKTSPNIARQSKMAYGIRHDYIVRDWPFMLDIHWKNYDWQDYMQKVAACHPVQAMAADYEHASQRRTLYRQLRDLKAAGVLRVMVCPKFAGAVAHIPSWCIIAISVPSKYAGYVPPLHELAGRRVHLLGGSPVQQRKWQIAIQGAGAVVVSADGNAHERKAQRAGWWTGERWQVIGARQMTPGMYEQLVIDSGRNIVAMLNQNAGLQQLSLFTQERKAS